MLRVTEILRQLEREAPVAPRRSLSGPVVVWNLVRRCNLSCLHCYAASSDRDFQGELSTQEVMTTLRDLKKARVPALILSGGEPLLRRDLFEIITEAKAEGFYLGLSTNGTLMTPEICDRIAEMKLDYVGISLDGLAERHDRIRGKSGAFQASLAALRLCRDRDVRAGVRLTLTRENYVDFNALLDLMAYEQIDRFYLSHLNYAGRGNAHREEDAGHRRTRTALEHLFETAWRDLFSGREYVTGNNDADGPFLLQWIQRRWPEKSDAARRLLVRWGGNASGVGIANIDNRGHVHPDIFWWNHTLGAVRERPFSEIWQDASDPLLAGLRQRPRPLKGRCARCCYLEICGGNTRVRAHQLTGDPWSEDPGCYLTDAEIA